jgi:RNA polymerase sigma-70 factor (ECF subfamily)
VRHSTAVPYAILPRHLAAARRADDPLAVLVNLTSQSLLDRLKGAKPSAPDWQRLQGIYVPLIRAWLSRVPGLRADADDLVQEVFVVVVRELPSFVRRRDGAFRAWLRQVTVNRVRTFRRARRGQHPVGAGDGTDDFLAQLEDPNSDFAKHWDRDHDAHVFQNLLSTIERDFEPRTWRAFTRFVLDGRPAAAVAEDLGMSKNAVLLAKSRILKRLREEAAGLLD